MFYELQQSLKKIIERYIAQMMPLTANANAGTNYAFVQSVRRFNVGDEVVIRNNNTHDAEVLTITAITSSEKRLVFDKNLIASWPATGGYVQKLLGFGAGNQEFLKAIYLGDPAVIQTFPAITIDARGLSSEWLTLESTQETYDIDITVYVDGLAHYESQYALMHYYVDAIRAALFRSFYPLVKPYFSTTLTAPVNEGDMTIQVADPNFAECAIGSWLFLEGADYLRSNRLIANLGSGIFQMLNPWPISFDIGDSAILPQRHIFKTIPQSVQYGTVNKGTTLKAAVISYKAYEEVRRFVPFVDPIAF